MPLPVRAHRRERRLAVQVLVTRGDQAAPHGEDGEDFERRRGSAVLAPHADLLYGKNLIAAKAAHLVEPDAVVLGSRHQFVNRARAVELTLEDEAEQVLPADIWVQVIEDRARIRLRIASFQSVGEGTRALPASLHAALHAADDRLEVAA